jgi:hypothetical protein
MAESSTEKSEKSGTLESSGVHGHGPTMRGEWGYNLANMDISLIIRPKGYSGAYGAPLYLPKGYS